MRCINWNIEWATAASRRGKRIAELLADAAPDIICLTEATLSIVANDGYMIVSDPDYGYPNDGDRRKVLIWSKQPWQQVDHYGNDALPGGRFVTGVTCGIRFIGVCIPWRDAHVRTGRRDRARWEDHLRYLEALGPLLASFAGGELPLCVLGDFNQRIPRSRQPQPVFQALSRALDGRLSVATAGLLDEDEQQLIDHIAASQNLAVRVERVIAKRTSSGRRLSDHAGILASLRVEHEKPKTPLRFRRSTQHNRKGK